MPRKATSGSFTKGDKRAGRPKGVPNKATIEIRAVTQGWLSDPEVQARTLADLRAGTLAPGIVTLLYHYAFGKPKETVEHQGDGGGPLSFTLRLDAPDRDV